MSVRSLPPIPASSHKKPVSSDEATSNDVSQIDAASPAADETYSSNTDAFTAPRTLAMLVLALLPFWSVPLSHAWSNSNTATGFFQYELPYYVANGRAAFERGNGVSYPNPYDPSPAAPAIYAHWLPWTLGLLTAKLGCDAGDVMLALTLFASLAFAWATRQLVFHRVGNQLSGDPTFKEFAFLLSMWGGGLLVIAGSVFNVFQSESWLSSVLQFDPGNGMWFLNWGRNALFPTEAIYHTLVALCWLAEIQQRHKASNIFLLLLATTHPWSGLELLLTINLWRLLELNYYQNRRTLNQVSISAIMLVAFLGYYKIWLPRFAQHSELQNVWELNWSLTWSSAIPAYLLVVIPAAIIVMRKIRFASASSTAPAVPATTNTSNGAEATLRPHHPQHLDFLQVIFKKMGTLCPLLTFSDNGASRRFEHPTFFHVPRHRVNGEALVWPHGSVPAVCPVHCDRSGISRSHYQARAAAALYSRLCLDASVSAGRAACFGMVQKRDAASRQMETGDDIRLLCVDC